MDGDYIEKWQINRQCCGFKSYVIVFKFYWKVKEKKIGGITYWLTLVDSLNYLVNLIAFGKLFKLFHYHVEVLYDFEGVNSDLL